ncbi:hypothetical protein CR513_45084, partial [Mucuna pruriens]
KCSPIIDGGSSVNVASLRLVEKLCLPTIPHLKPYKLQWFSEKGEMVVDKQVMLNSPWVESDQSQRENIFHLRCMIQGKCSSILIDKGSSVNVASLRLVEKLCLPTTPHPKPYKLQSYKNEILCDVVPMEATHILLGRPWQFDRKVTHDGVTNKFSFVHKGNKVILKPLTLREIMEDKLKMKKQEEKKEIEKETN